MTKHKITWWPLRRCKRCRRLYWAGLPRWSRELVSMDSTDHKRWLLGVNCKRAWVVLWMPGWFEYCGQKCAQNKL